MISLLDNKQIYKINDLIKDYPFSDYRFYNIPKEKLYRYSYNQFLKLAMDKNAWVFVNIERKKINGISILRCLQWDTRHFEMRMGGIEYLIAQGFYWNNRKIKNKLLSFMLRFCQERKIFHLSAKIDANDISSIHVLEKNGFKLMDTSITYIFSKNKKIPNLRSLYKVRNFRKGDLNTLVDLAKRSFRRHRFYFDPFIPSNKADDLYGEWLKNYCKNPLIHKVLVAERNKKVVGFFAYRLNKDIERAMGYKIASRGLLSVSPKAKGAFVSLAKAACHDVILNYDFGEFDTQINNFETIKMCQRFGLDLIRVKYIFHRWNNKIKE